VVSALERVHAAALQLLPPGRAFTRRAGSALSDLLEALSLELARARDEVDRAWSHSVPSEALEYIDAWERALQTESIGDYVEGSRGVGWVRVAGINDAYAMWTPENGYALSIHDSQHGVVPLAVLGAGFNLAGGLVAYRCFPTEEYAGEWTNFTNGTPVHVADWAKTAYGYADGFVVGAEAALNFNGQHYDAIFSGTGFAGGVDPGPIYLPLEVRRAALVAKLVGYPLTNRARWEAEANAYGFTIQGGPQWFQPFAADSAKAGDRVFDEPWAHVMRLQIAIVDGSWDDKPRLVAALNRELKRAHTLVLIDDGMQLEPEPDYGEAIAPGTIRAFAGTVILTVVDDGFTGVPVGAVWTLDAGAGAGLQTYRNQNALPAGGIATQYQVELVLTDELNNVSPYGAPTLTGDVGDPGDAAFQASYNHTLDIFIAFSEQLIVPEWD
jgi:uncharacterized protein YmfQ (DUF2313 family)